MQLRFRVSACLFLRVAEVENVVCVKTWEMHCVFSHGEQLMNGLLTALYGNTWATI